MSGDVNAIMRKFLVGKPAITDIVGERIYCPRLPEKATLPALGFFTRGGTANPYIPPIVEPGFQFDCWANDPLAARSLYTALYDSLQGVENQNVVVDAVTYGLLSAIEEVQGQDLRDVDYPNYYRVIAFFRALIRIGT